MNNNDNKLLFIGTYGYVVCLNQENGFENWRSKKINLKIIEFFFNKSNFFFS